MNNFTELSAPNLNCIHNGTDVCKGLVPHDLVLETSAAILVAGALASLAYKNRGRLQDCMSAVRGRLGMFAGQDDDVTQTTSLLEEGHTGNRPGQ